MSERTSVISLGAGVQSSVLLLMAARGGFGPDGPRLAVFADTGAEPEAVYDHLAWLEREVAGRVEVARASGGDLEQDILDAAAGVRPRVSNPPVFTAPEGMVDRSCTRDYKVRVIRAELRRRGFGPARPVETWKGITVDEVERMKQSGVQWEATAYPFMDLGMTRGDCERWAATHYPDRAPFPKSACVFCPYMRDDRWRAIKAKPGEWKRAVRVDKAIRRGLPGVKRDAFLHRQRVPLPMVDLSTPEDRGQGSFGDECEGVCGV